MSVRILQGDVRAMLATLPPDSVQCVVTSPPYFQLRSYLASSHPDKAKEMGSESTPSEFVASLVGMFTELRRVLRPDGVVFVNLGDSYAGSGKGPTGHNGIGDQSRRQGFTGEGKKRLAGRAQEAISEGCERRPGRGVRGGAGYELRDPLRVEGCKPKDLILIPERFAIAMQDAGWWVRSRIAWCKTSAMPESVKDRPTSAWEHIWMFTKSARYFWDQEGARQPSVAGHGSGQKLRSMNHQPGRGAFGTAVPWESQEYVNLRNYWLLGPEPSREDHYAAFPTEIPRRCILAASRRGDTILDPFLGTGTTALVADQLGRDAIGIELNPMYVEIARRRIAGDAPMFTDVAVS